MATIKDVAKRAGVSLGTASNVLNGKTQNEELIQRVEAAMEELGYRPDANARSLKNTQSTLIGVILPNIQQKEYADFLYNAEHFLKEKNYNILVKFSRNNKLVERKCLEACLQQHVAGIILYSDIKRKDDSVLADSHVPCILITKQDSADYGGDRILLNYESAFETAVSKLAGQKKSDIGLIMERELLQNDRLRNLYHSYFPGTDNLKIAESSQERGYQAMFELYTANPGIQAVIAGSSLIGIGVRKAIETLGISDIDIIVLKESSWIEDAGNYSAQLTISQKKIAFLATGRILEAIENPKLHENMTNVVNADYDRISSIHSGIQKSEGNLRFAMYDCSSARSLQMLSGIYEKESGCKITLDLYKYRELEALLYRNAENRERVYDGFMMDITWLEGVIESGGVENLDGLWKEHREYFDGFIEGVLKDYGMYVESLYAIPFMSGAQILFYQKDLFEDKALKFRFRRLYGEELTPPRTWAQFNLVAEFFTRSFNPQSPVEYGVSLPKGVNVYTAISFLSRLWAYESRIFDVKGNVVLNNSNAVAALKNFITSYQYTSDKKLISWNDVADEFAQGISAMTILYDSDAGSINNYTRSKVAGNLGYALLPGRNPVLGGWSLGLNRYGTHLDKAKDFLLWACGNQNSIPLSLLGGSTLRRDFYVRSDLESMEPWKTLILSTYKQSRKRYMPEILDESKWKNNIYTELIPLEIEKVIRGEITEKDAIGNMQDKIQRLVWQI